VGRRPEGGVDGPDDRSAERRGQGGPGQGAEGQAKRKQPRRTPTSTEPAPGEVASTTPVTSEPPARPVAPAAHPEATTATLRIHFRSEGTAATVIVYANTREIFRKTYGSGGLFHKGGGPIEDTASSSSFPAGTVDLLVNVTPAGKAALVRKKSGNFPGGSARTLEIQLSSPTEIAVDLR